MKMIEFFNNETGTFEYEYRFVPEDFKVDIERFRAENAFVNEGGFDIFNLPCVTKKLAEEIVGHAIDESTYMYEYCKNVTYITDYIDCGALVLEEDCLYIGGGCHKQIVSKEGVKYIISVLQNIYENYEEYITNILERSVSDFLLCCSEISLNEKENTRKKSKKEIRRNPSSSAGEIGYIYVMKNCGYYKIGKSKDCGRLGEYTKLPEEPEYIVLEKVYNYSKVEKALHEHYADKRLRNGVCEWFDLTDDDLLQIKEFVNKYLFDKN